MRKLKEERKGFKRHHNDAGSVAGFYTHTVGSGTLKTYIQEVCAEELRVNREQGEVITYKLTAEELKKYY